MAIDVGGAVVVALAAAQDDVAVRGLPRSRRWRPGPSWSCPMKACGACGLMASTATFTPPSVPFLKPTGTPGRWRAGGGSGFLSLRARRWRPSDQVADELRLSRSRNSGAHLGGRAPDVQQADARARSRPSLMGKLPSRRGSLMSPFQLTVVRGFEATRASRQADPAPASALLQQPRVPMACRSRNRPIDDDQPVVLAVQHARQLYKAAGLHPAPGAASGAGSHLQDGGVDQGADGLDAGRCAWVSCGGWAGMGRSMMVALIVAPAAAPAQGAPVGWRITGPVKCERQRSGAAFRANCSMVRAPAPLCPQMPHAGRLPPNTTRSPVRCLSSGNRRR